MTTHLYCVLPLAAHATLPLGLNGLRGAAVRAVEVDELVAWVSDVDRGSPPDIEGVKAHDAVVQAALETGTTPVPARYGQRFDDDGALGEALSRQGESIRAALANVQGFVEMTLLLTPSTKRMIHDLEPVLPEMVDETPGRGRRYLETLRAREAATGAVRRALDGLAQGLAEVAQRFARRVSVQENPTRLPIRTISHLVAREAVEQYRSALDAVRPPADSRFLVIGPRAPYSFSSLGRNGGNHGMKLED